MNRRSAGFTLVEILVVLAMVGVLGAIFLSVFGRVRENGRRATCQSNLRQLNLALRQYVSDNDATYPAYEIWPSAVLPYAKSHKLYECPTESNATPVDWSEGYQTDYELNAELLNKFSTRKWRGVGESKLAHFDSSRLWTLADSPSNDDSFERNGEVPSSCHDDGATVVALVRHAKGSNYAFADGRVKWLDTQGFADILCSVGTSVP